MSSTTESHAVARTEKTRLRRTFDHVATGLTFNAPLNFATVLILSSLISSPAVIAVASTAIATAFSGIRTYWVLSYHEQ